MINTDKHALKISHMSVIEQQRVLKKLAKNSRSHSMAKLKTHISLEADTYDWHRTVRLKREARAFNLLRAYNKGVPYIEVEANLRKETIPAIEILDYLPLGLTLESRHKLEDWIYAEIDDHYGFMQHPSLVEDLGYFEEERDGMQIRGGTNWIQITI